MFAVLAVSGVSTAWGQAVLSGPILVEPIIGVHWEIEGSPSFYGEPERTARLVGIRAQREHAFDRSAYAEVTFAWRRSEGDGLPREYSGFWRGVVGVGSTLIDRNATGSHGLHLLLGAGLILNRYSQDDPQGSDYRISGTSAVLSPTGVFEVEISRSILMRASVLGHLAYYLQSTNEDTDFWVPGLSLAVGIVASLQ